MQDFFGNTLGDLHGSSTKKLTMLIRLLRRDNKFSSILFMAERAPIIGEHVRYIFNDLPKDQKALDELLEVLSAFIEKLKTDAVEIEVSVVE